MKVYNSLSGQKEELVLADPPKLKMYVCGPTTYNYIHLGNARPLVVFDTVRRYLEFKGYEVTYVQNFTDIDDKIINRAAEEGMRAQALSEMYIDEYFVDADRLGIRRADVHPRVSKHIPQIVESIRRLVEKGYAYEVDGDVYYRVKAFSEYGKLSHRSLEDMLAGSRVEVDDRKEAPVDFALWKAAKEGEPYWPSPWGPGRPGWHIECSVMSMHYLGDTLDIHGGGSDLIFPHHENEIAQAEALTGKPFVKYWMHNGFITVNSEKMSKSLGNFFILRDILDKFPADVVRFYLIATHYRSPLDFDDGKLEEARRALGRLKNTMFLAKEYLEGKQCGEDEALDEVAEVFIKEVQELQVKFMEAMDDDFNTAKALGFLFEMARQINSYITANANNETQNIYVVKKASSFFYELGQVMGFFMDQDNEVKDICAELVSILLELRTIGRLRKDYREVAVTIRDYLLDNKVSIEDTEKGTKFKADNYPPAEELVQELINWRAYFKNLKEYQEADYVRQRLQDVGVIIEDTREGVRWKFADA